MRSAASDVPWFVRAVDGLAVALLLLAGTVAITGGFREWTPFGRISMTSWPRPLMLALLIIAVRHWRYPTPTLIAAVAAAVVRWREDAAVRVAVPVALGTRGAVLLVGFLAVVLFGYRPDTPLPWRVYDHEFWNLPARWDSGWYLQIALEGYEFSHAFADRQQNIAFFPLYPMVLRYSSLLFAREVLWTGVIVSWASFAAALVYLYRFAQHRIGADGAGAAVALLACYPFALFYATAYTEALFLLTTVAACWHFERDERWRAALWGVAAGLCRPNGCLLSVVLALIAVGDLRLERQISWARFADRIAVAATPGIGMLIYSTYIFWLSGNPFQWTVQNAAWGRVYSGLDVLVAQHAVNLGSEGLYTFAATRTLDTLQLAAVLFVLASVWPVWRRLGLPYAVMILVTVLPPLTMGGLLSMGRVTSVLFPTFVWLGAVVPATHRPAWLAGMAMLQAICAALFFTWRPLF